MAVSAPTVEDGLKKVYSEVASLQLLPDAATHAQFLSMLQQGIQKYLASQAQRQQQQAAQQAQQLAGGQMGGAPGPQGGPGGAPGGAPLGPPPGPAQFGPGGASGGGSPGIVNMPNPDELRRVLAGSSGTAA